MVTASLKSNKFKCPNLKTDKVDKDYWLGYCKTEEIHIFNAGYKKKIVQLQILFFQSVHFKFWFVHLRTLQYLDECIPQYLLDLHCESNMQRQLLLQIPNLLAL